MGSNLNFKNFSNEPPGNGDGDGVNRPPGNFPLARQTSIYSLTFDEFQSSLGKDFGSMNMDELLKNIWTAEETQAMASTSGGGGGAGAGSSAAIAGGSGLQRQGSLTLPRTLSQKTVDEVWKDFSIAGKDSVGGGSSNMPQRQQTLGEMTLEEFLVRAGVVREETQVAGKGNNGGFFGNNISNAGLVIGFQQDSSRVSNLMGDRGHDASNPPLNMMNGVRLNQQQQPILPKQPKLGFGTPQGNSQLGSPGIRSGVVGLGNVNNAGLVQNAAFQNAGYGLAGGGFQVGVVVGAGSSPVTPLSSDGIGKSNGEISSVSPAPYSFGGGFRGRRSSCAVEKVAERRQRRMIKNRESAARSRARKQAYTTELEAEVAKLKEENEELKRKQAELMELQKNQATVIMNLQGGPKKRLRRTQSGPW